ncbi:MAG: SOS response-associated peptidase [Prosthecochloris sp.]|nr:SOS response-associated peptidase [Prosthecochloris sp.]
MCGRYVLSMSMKDIARIFHVNQLLFDFEGSYNIAPSQTVPIVVHDKEALLVPARWGFIPAWAEDPAIGQRMINARAETVAEKPAFRKAFHSQRSIVPASGFYEWKTKGRTKQPIYIRLRTDRIMAMAGIYNTWVSREGERVEAFAIITMPPNDLLKPIHNRMPAILHESDYEAWLGSNGANDAVPSVLQPFPADEMDAYEVSKRVNVPTNDSEENIHPVRGSLMW